MGLLIRASIRHHARRPSRALLTAAGISAAVALLFATSVLNSTLRASIDTSVRGLGGHASVEVIAPVSSGLGPKVRRIVARTSGIEATIPLIRTTTRMQTPHGTERVLILGVPPAFEDLYPGELGDAAADIAALRGSAARLGPGLESDERSSHMAIVETPRGYRRIGPIEAISPIPFADLNAGAFVLMSLGTANKLFMKQGRVDALYVVAAKGTRPAMLRRKLGLALQGRAVLRRPGSETRAYKQTFDSLAQLTELGAVGALWVALFAVFNAMSMSLLERRRTVALLSTLGATRLQLATAFLAEAAVFGAVGAVIGMGVGYLIAELLLQNSLEAYPFLPLSATNGLEVTPLVLVGTACASLVVALLGAAIPVRRTLRVAPVEGLNLDPSYEWTRYQRGSRSEGVRLVIGLLCCLVVAAGVSLHLPSEANGLLGPALLILLLSGVMLALPPIVAGLLRVAGWLLQRAFGPLGALATGSLIKNRGRSTITVGMLAISLALVVSLSTALGSFESTMTRVFVDRYGPPLYLTSASYSGLTSDQPLPGDLTRRLIQVPGVRAAYPQRYLPFNIRGRQAVVVSAPMIREARDGFSNAIVNTRGASRQSLISGLAHGGVVPSVYAASLHDLDVGARFSLPGLSRRRSPKVVGIYDDVLSIETMYMERRAYVKISGDTSIDRIAVAPEPGIPPAILKRRLETFLTSNRVPAVIETRAALIDEIFTNVRGAFAIARAIQVAGLIIAALIVAGTMLATVSERQWEFAICRALGMSRMKIRGEVMLEALVIGAVGAAIALGVGLVTGVLMLELMESRFLWTIGYSPPWSQLSLALLAATVAVLMVSLLPADLARRASIVDTLGST